MTAAEGERAGRSEKFLGSLNLFLLAGKDASKEERQAFLAARGKLLLQVLMLLGRVVDKREMKDLRTAVAYVLETCLEEGGPSVALNDQSKCCQVTCCARRLDCQFGHHSHNMAMIELIQYRHALDSHVIWNTNARPNTPMLLQMHTWQLRRIVRAVLGT